ncbi:hypothetical protein ACLOJK_034309, partial [Asimina triloba]
EKEKEEEGEREPPSLLRRGVLLIGWPMDPFDADGLGVPMVVGIESVPKLIYEQVARGEIPPLTGDSGDVYEGSSFDALVWRKVKRVKGKVNERVKGKVKGKEEGK